MCYSGAVENGQRRTWHRARLRRRRSASISDRCRTPRGRRRSIRCSTPGARNYWKSHNFAASRTALIDVAARRRAQPARRRSARFSSRRSAAPRRGPAEATAYLGRDASYVDERARPLGRCRATTRAASAGRAAFFDAAAPFATGSVYVNFMTEDEGERVAGVRRELRAPAGAQAPLRPGQSVPHEPEHRAGERL